MLCSRFVYNTYGVEGSPQNTEEKLVKIAEIEENDDENKVLTEEKCNDKIISFMRLLEWEKKELFRWLLLLGQQKR